jgi:hypothetical protein
MLKTQLVLSQFTLEMHHKSFSFSESVRTDVIIITKIKKEAINHNLAFFIINIFFKSCFGPKGPSSGNTYMYIQNYEEE